MLVKFSVLKSHLLEQAIPQLLSVYSVTKIIHLPSPLQGDLLFLKALLRLVEQNQLCCSSEVIAGSVLTLIALYPELDAWGCGISGNQNEILSGDEKERFISSFLYFMFQRLRKGQGESLLLNADSKGQLLNWWEKALSLRTEILKLQWISALSTSPVLKLPSSECLEQMDLNAVDAFFSYFNLREMPWANKVSEPKKEGFIKEAFHYLNRCEWPVALKLAAYRGVILLEEALCKDDFLHDYKIPKDPLSAWEAHYGAWFLCKIHLFKQGRANLGPAMVPLFGLSDVDVTRYWHQSLMLSEQALLQLVTTWIQVLQPGRAKQQRFFKGQSAGRVEGRSEMTLEGG